jgi:uncharacterized protein YxjI
MKSLIIEQKITAFANQYRVYEAGDQGVKGALLAFAHQKRLAVREKIEFFSNEERGKLVFSVQAEKVLDVHGKFSVNDASGAHIGTIRKVFKSSLLRSTWKILDDQDGPLIVIRERSVALAIFRRVWQFLPYLGDFPFILKYHFDFLEPVSGDVLATYVKTKLLYDHYRLEIISDRYNLDWRVAAAQCVMLDALQGR